jgi:O-antigen/teichoic acid export membrane protein
VTHTGRRPRLVAVVGRLTAANVVMGLAAFVTGPLLARALGADGRGDLAAVLVPLGLLPFVLSFGVAAYSSRETARGHSVGEIIGSLGLPLVVVGALAATLAVPVADALAEGRETVRVCLIVCFAASPVLLVSWLLYSCLVGLERWRAVIATRLIPVVLSLVATVGLYVTGHLTVATAAATALVGALLAVVPALSLFGRGSWPRFRLATAREGFAFGLKNWVGSLAAIANTRLDQVVMITVVPPRELGLYAVSVTLAGACHYLVTAITPPLLTRVSAGEVELLPRVLRVTLALTVALDVVIAAVTPVLLPGLFGPEFADAIDMALVLLAASVPYVGASVLNTGLIAVGAPLTASIGEALAIVLTVLGLAVLLVPLGGLGAAIVSLVAYSASFVFQLAMFRRRMSVPLRAYLLPTGADLRWARSLR